MFDIFLIILHPPPSYFFFFFNDTATTEIYTLSLHDALPISVDAAVVDVDDQVVHISQKHALVGVHLHANELRHFLEHATQDRKSTRLNSSHSQISYAVFCLKKKKRTQHNCKSSEDKTCTTCR